MLKNLCVFLMVLTCVSSCVKDPLKELGKARAEFNGEPWEAWVSLHDSRLGDSTLIFSLIQYIDNEIDYELHAVEDHLFFWGVRKNMDKQTLYFNSRSPGSDFPQFSIRDHGWTVYALLEADSANNFIRILSEKGNYTNKVEVEFSATVVKVDDSPLFAADYPDTVRIRNGLFTTKRMK